jgi:CRP/FNR family transcriptional regulator
MCQVAGLDTKDIALLESMVMRRQRIAKDETLIAAGKSFDTIYAIKSGAFKTVTTTADGQEQIINFHFPGELIGLEAVEHGRHAYSVLPLEDSSVCRLNYANLNVLGPRMKDFQHQLIRAMSRRVLHDQWMSALLGTQHAEQRVAAFIVSIAARLSDRGLPAHQFRLPMSRDDIGNYLGLAVETVSRMFKQFHNRDILMARGRNTQIKDIDALKGIANIRPLCDIAV